MFLLCGFVACMVVGWLLMDRWLAHCFKRQVAAELAGARHAIDVEQDKQLPSPAIQDALHRQWNQQHSKKLVQPQSPPCARCRAPSYYFTDHGYLCIGCLESGKLGLALPPGTKIGWKGDVCAMVHYHVWARRIQDGYDHCAECGEIKEDIA